MQDIVQYVNYVKKGKKPSLMKARQEEMLSLEEKNILETVKRKMRIA